MEAMRPEDYWIGLGENVIGMDVLTEGENARQAATYQAIANWIVSQPIHILLDVGCNLGALDQFLQDAHYAGGYVGLDSNPYVAPRWSKKFIQGNLRELCFPNNYWQCVVIKDVIEHLEGIEPLREAFRVSSQYMIIATYLPWHDAPTLIMQHPDGYYTNVYNRQDVTTLARACDFRLIDTIRTWESNGDANEITVWERVE